MQNLVASWIVFFVVGGISAFLRYGGTSGTADITNIMMEYGKWVVLVIYLFIVLAAFKDAVFQGILALLIPFYGFYWLFFVSDAFMMRALVGGLLAGLGQDFCIWFNEVTQSTMVKVQTWIGSGG